MQDVSDKLIRTDTSCGVSRESSFLNFFIGESDFCFFSFSLSSGFGVEVSAGEAGDCICLFGVAMVNLRPSGILKEAPSFFRSIPLNRLSQGYSCSSTLRASFSLFNCADNSRIRCRVSNHSRRIFSAGSPCGSIVSTLILAKRSRSDADFYRRFA